MLKDDKMIELLDRTFSKLEITGEKAWIYLIQYKFISALLGVIFGSILMSINICMCIWLIKNWKSYIEKFEGVLIAVVSISLFLCGMSILILSINIPNMIYPEASVVHDIIRTLGGR